MIPDTILLLWINSNILFFSIKQTFSNLIIYLTINSESGFLKKPPTSDPQNDMPFYK
jgi:hypothetical protein